MSIVNFAVRMPNTSHVVAMLVTFRGSTAILSIADRDKLLRQPVETTAQIRHIGDIRSILIDFTLN
jgi:hypothetical protein